MSDQSKASDGAQRTIRVPVLTRVEGEGALNIRLRGPNIERVELNIYEPPRFFEALLRGRPIEDVADITSRICGICPIAYQMTAVQALESILGVQVHPQIAMLRRLVYCAEWIESHVLHIHLLHAPDFFDCHSAVELAQRFPMEVKRGLRLKQTGNRILEVLGGRAIHPINIAIGGFYRLPKVQELRDLIPRIEQGLSDAIDAARWLASLPLPNFSSVYNYVSLVHSERYPIESGQIAIGPDEVIEVGQYESHFQEVQVPHSTALQSRKIPGDTEYFVGPLARMYNNQQRLGERSGRLADDLKFDPRACNPYQSLLARAIEVVYAFEESLRILRGVDSSGLALIEPRVGYEPRAGVGVSATEAPRGLIFHRYQIDDSGLVELAKIVPPTSQNQSRIEADLRALLEQIHDQADGSIAVSCERLVRCYDPCISCSTHFLKVKIQRE
ncbi:MAG: Ni/Fe hydrogenase subunit alpha [Planctomycetota bacterium]